MGLRGWRLIGVAGTLFVYISGILFLSFVSLQTPHDRHPKNKLFGGDVSFEHSCFYSTQITSVYAFFFSLNRFVVVNWAF
jgi:hypothetical protein